MYHCKCFLVTFKKHLQWCMRWYMRFILHDSIWTLLDTWHVTHNTRESFACYTRVICMLKERYSFSVHSLLTHSPYSLILSRYTPYSLPTHSLPTHSLTPYSLTAYSLTHHTCTCARARARKKHRCRAVRKSKPATLIKDSLVTPVVITKLNLN